MKIKEFIEEYEKGGVKWIRGQFVLYESQETEDELIGIAIEDVKKDKKKDKIVKLRL